MAWLIAEGETPSRLAARVKLRSSATTTKADNAVRSFSAICELYSLALVLSGPLSFAPFRLTLELEKTKPRPSSSPARNAFSEIKFASGACPHNIVKLWLRSSGSTAKAVFERGERMNSENYRIRMQLAAFMVLFAGVGARAQATQDAGHIPE